jgi:hypothetical protein
MSTGEEEDKALAPEDRILRLVRLIDRNEDKLFRWYDIFHSSYSVVIIFGLIWFLIFVEDFLIFGSASLPDKMVVSLTFLLVAIAALTFLKQVSEEGIITKNFNRMKEIYGDEERKLEDKEKPLLKENDPFFLKALIRMKAKNREIHLEQIYNANKDMFTEKRLLERLYE